MPGLLLLLCGYNALACPCAFCSQEHCSVQAWARVQEGCSMHLGDTVGRGRGTAGWGWWRAAGGRCPGLPFCATKLRVPRKMKMALGACAKKSKEKMGGEEEKKGRKKRRGKSPTADTAVHKTVVSRCPLLAFLGFLLGCWLPWGPRLGKRGGCCPRGPHQKLLAWSWLVWYHTVVIWELPLNPRFCFPWGCAPAPVSSKQKAATSFPSPCSCPCTANGQKENPLTWSSAAPIAPPGVPSTHHPLSSCSCWGCHSSLE